MVRGALSQKKISMKTAFILIITLMSISCTHSQEDLPEVSQGSIQRIPDFKSNYVTARNIDIWLPDDYSKNKRYSVLYMHDGQMLYDAKGSWNKQSWEMDEAAHQLYKRDACSKEFIIVGIWNGGETRHSDYFPQKPFEMLTKDERNIVSEQLKQSHVPLESSFTPTSDNYLKFIVRELKPHIDEMFNTYTDKDNTYIAGSSMGGLISMYALCEYPQVFGGAACLSTHWPGTFTLENNPIPNAFKQYLKNNLPDPATHKLYFDCGDETLDALYPEIQKEVDFIIKEKGYTAKNWRTGYFPGENHSENAWRDRVIIPLEFLFQ